MSRKKIERGIRRIILTLPGGSALVRAHASFRAHRRFARRFPRAADAKEIFRRHYESNEWGEAESVSGPGSTLKYTENIRKMIPKIAEEFGVREILDAPCGDYNWFRAIAWKTRVSYLGGDIVDFLVERNQAVYGAHDTRFISLDIISDALPKADMWLCRDCLFHLSERDIFCVLDNFLKSEIDYLLTSTHPSCVVNSDIPTGSFRLLNLQLPPFNLGKPALAIDDWIEGFPERQLALWKRDAVREALASNKTYQKAVASAKT